MKETGAPALVTEVEEAMMSLQLLWKGIAMLFGRDLEICKRLLIFRKRKTFCQKSLSITPCMELVAWHPNPQKSPWLDWLAQRNKNNKTKTHEIRHDNTDFDILIRSLVPDRLIWHWLSELMFRRLSYGLSGRWRLSLSWASQSFFPRATWLAILRVVGDNST